MPFVPKNVEYSETLVDRCLRSDDGTEGVTVSTKWSVIPAWKQTPISLLSMTVDNLLKLQT